MGLSDRFTRLERAVLLACLSLQTVNTTVGYYVFDWFGIADGLIVPAVLLAGGVLVLPILGVVVLTRPKDGWTVPGYQYAVSQFDDD